MKMKERLFLCILFLGSLSSSLAQEASFMGNPIKLLRELQVHIMLEDSATTIFLEHGEKRTRISYQLLYISYLNTDSLEYSYNNDSIWVPINFIEDHYFNLQGTVDSSFYLSTYPDSVGFHTSKIIRYSYRPDGQLDRKTELSNGYDTVLTQYNYFRSGKRLDSIHKYSNTSYGTFGPVYHDSLELIRKFRYSYDSLDRPRMKLKYVRDKGTLVEYYTYPTENTLVTSEAAYHPIRGCIMDPSISYSTETTIVYRPDGLVQENQTYYRKKVENGVWQVDQSLSQLYHYQMN